MENPKTYGEALAMGWKCGDTRLQRGYISRKSHEEDLPVEIAGGTRNGELYVLRPNWASSQYCIRQYLYR